MSKTLGKLLDLMGEIVAVIAAGAFIVLCLAALASVISLPVILVIYLLKGILG